jgi:hypothetical protein
LEFDVCLVRGWCEASLRSLSMDCFPAGEEGRGKYDAVPKLVGGDGRGFGSGEDCRAWRQDE